MPKLDLNKNEWYYVREIRATVLPRPLRRREWESFCLCFWLNLPLPATAKETYRSHLEDALMSDQISHWTEIGEVIRKSIKTRDKFVIWHEIRFITCMLCFEMAFSDANIDSWFPPTTVSWRLVRAAHRSRAHTTAKGFFLRSVHLRRDWQKFLHTRVAHPDHAKGMFHRGILLKLLNLATIGILIGLKLHQHRETSWRSAASTTFPGGRLGGFRTASLGSQWLQSMSSWTRTTRPSTLDTTAGSCH